MMKFLLSLVGGFAFHTFKVDRHWKMSIAAMDLFQTKIKNCEFSRKYS